MNIPLVNLKRQADQVRKAVLQDIAKVIDKCNYILGEDVVNFENAFAEYCQSEFCIGVASGTDALHLAVRAMGLGKDDEVLVPANTFIATALGVSYTGAKIVPIDCGSDGFLVPVENYEAACTDKTRAIVPVHLYGEACEMDLILNLAKQRNLTIIEDAAQAHGAKFNGKPVGGFGAFGCFSFYPGKNLGAFGDAGAIITNDEKLADRVRSLRNYGSLKKYHHPEVGYNSRLDTIQAVVLNEKLKLLDTWNRERFDAARMYNKIFSEHGLEIITPKIPEDEQSHVFHLYVIRTKNRDQLLKHLNSNGIGAGIHYPTVIHKHGAYADLANYHLPNSEMYAEQILSLPIFPGIQQEEIETVTSEIKKFFKR